MVHVSCATCCLRGRIFRTGLGNCTRLMRHGDQSEQVGNCVKFDDIRRAQSWLTQELDRVYLISRSEIFVTQRGYPRIESVYRCKLEYNWSRVIETLSLYVCADFFLFFFFATVWRHVFNVFATTTLCIGVDCERTVSLCKCAECSCSVSPSFFVFFGLAFFVVYVFFFLLFLSLLS